MYLQEQNIIEKNEELYIIKYISNLLSKKS